MSDEVQPDTNLLPNTLSIGVVASKFNINLSDFLLQRVKQCIFDNGVPLEFIVERVPGAHEIPAALSLMLKSKRFSCMIALGVVIKGSTSHHHLVAEISGHAIQRLILDHGVPIINGIVVTDSYKDAEERITGSMDRGHEFAHAALQMGHMQKKWTKT